MKKAKKMLLAASALALVSFGFGGCSAEDDENEMIEKIDSNNYSINHTNGSGDTSRGYKAATLSHRGAAMEFKFTNATATSGGGVLGFIWELDEKKDGTREFFVLGIRQDNGVPSYYVSQFKNVTDINAENFGTKLDKNPAVENPISPAAGKGNAVHSDFNKIDGQSWAVDGVVSVYADIAPVNGGYEIRFYKSATAAENQDTPNAKGVKITVDSDLATATAQPPKKDVAVYANVYKDKTLTGSWKFIKDRAAEVVEAE